MNNGLDYYPHSVNAHHHRKFRSLRRKYGWAGEGMFWALNSYIAQAEDCWLDLSDETVTDMLSDDFDMGDEEFKAFISCLVDKIKLLVRKGDKVTTATLQETYEKVNEDRKKKSAAGKKSAAKRRKKATGVEQVLNRCSTDDEQSKVKESKEEKSKEEPPAAAAPSSQLSAEEFIKRHSEPREPFTPFIEPALPSFQGGTEEDFRSIYQRIADHLNGNSAWKDISAIAKCKMSAPQFKEELEAWIRYYLNKKHLYTKPVQSLRGGPISFINWLRKPWVQEKYNQAAKEAAQPRRNGPIRRTIKSSAA